MISKYPFHYFGNILQYLPYVAYLQAFDAQKSWKQKPICSNQPTNDTKLLPRRSPLKLVVLAACCQWLLVAGVLAGSDATAAR